MTAYKTGAEAIQEVRSESDTILLAFSCGKDSIGAWLECRKHFRRVIPFYMVLVPELQFVERSLSYYEQWFGQRIVRVPHPSLYRMLRNTVFQPPEHVATIRVLRLAQFDYSDVYRLLRKKMSLPEDAYVATGVRAVDSPYRMIAMRKYGPINRKTKTFWPIADWHKERLRAEIASSGVRLPADYRVFGRSPIHDTWPEDYATILRYFPLAELELKRREYAG